MNSNFILSLDQTLLGSMLSNESSDYPILESRECVIEWLDLLSDLVSRLPVREQDLIHWYFVLGKSQVEISDMVGVSQSSSSSRLRRAVFRIKFLLTMPLIQEDMFYDVLKYVGICGYNADIMWYMYNTSCKSETAKKVGMSVGRIRVRFDTSLEQLRDYVSMNPDDIDAYEILDALYMVSDNLKVLHQPKVHDEYRDRYGISITKL